MQYITESDGRRRPAKRVRCARCGSSFLKALRLIGKSEKNYCSRACKDAAGSRRVNLVCAYCGMLFTRAAHRARLPKHGLCFCSRSCKDKAQRLESGGRFSEMRPNHYGASMSGANARGYRAKAFRTHGAVCAVCGYSREDVLVVHHVDGDRDNNSEDNLRVLCPTHHVEQHVDARVGL